MGMTSFRRSAIHNSANKGKGRGGGNWYEEIRLPQGAATPFVFINAEYIDLTPPSDLIQLGPDGRPLPVKNSYYKYNRHTKKEGQRYIQEVCSSGTNPHEQRPCAGCTAMDMGDKSITLSERFVFGIYHLVPYHAHPLHDKKTGQRRLKQDGSPIISYTECEGRQCNFCRTLANQPPVLKPGEFWPNYAPADIKTEFGHRRFLNVGKSHLSNLEGWDQSITSICSSHVLGPKGELLGKCNQQLIRESFNCPECGTVLIDMGTDPRSDAEIDAAVSRPYPCLKCNKGVMAKEIVACEACEQAQRPYTQLGLFDVVVWGRRQGEGTKSQLALQQFQTLEEFQKSLPPHVLQMMGGKSLLELVKNNATPYDFDRIFEPRPVEEQAARLGVQLSNFQQPQMGGYEAPPFQMAPQQPVNMGQHAVPYPGPAPFQAPVKPNFSK